MGRVGWSCLFVFAVAVAPLVAPPRGSVSETALYPVTVAPPPMPPAPPPPVMSAPAPRPPATPRRPAALRPPSVPPAPPSLTLVGLALPDVPVPAVPMLETLPVTSALSLHALLAVRETPSRLTLRENAPPRPRPASLLPMYASFATLQALDYHSTTRAISQGIGREANPLARSIVEHPAGFLAMKAGATAGMIWASERMRKKHPGRAVVLMLASNATMAVIVAHNYSIR
jgi:uncharacterized protein DUF5658